MIRCRAYEPGQEDAFLTLYRACLAHYRIAPATAAEEAHILDLMARGRHMSCLIAWDGARPVGFATWALTFPAGAGTALYMKELFVDAAARGRGAGRALLAALVAQAREEGCLRMDWQTDRSNPEGQAFYAALGAPAFDKLSYRIPASDFDSFHAALAQP